MRIKKWVTFEEEVEIDVSAEDITLILSESPESERVVLAGISSFYEFIKSASDETLNKLSKEHRAIIRKALLEQADRFKESEHEG